MKYTRLHTWPFGDSHSLAKEFFDKAKNSFAKFPYEEDAAICLCEGPNGSFCLVFLDSDSWEDDSIAKSDSIRKFLNESGCPEAHETEDANYDGQMAIDTIDRSLSYASVSVIERIERRT